MPLETSIQNLQPGNIGAMPSEPDDTESVDYKTKVDVAYDQLRRWILSGRLKPGEKLDQTWLATHLRVSRTPLRQALLRLVAEKLIEAEPHRSAVVAPLSLIEMEDLYQSRRVLEAMLGEVAAANCSESLLEKMRQVLNLQDTALAADDSDRFTDLDREFHFLLYRSAGYARAYDITQALRDASERYVRFYMVHKGGAAESLGEHRRILQLCAAHDVKGVREEIEHHVIHGLETVRQIAADLQRTDQHSDSTILRAN
jgi:DNA-binding GntR family transcriptional regulator